jgi:hypothetical protein
MLGSLFANHLTCAAIRHKHVNTYQNMHLRTFDLDNNPTNKPKTPNNHVSPFDLEAMSAWTASIFDVRDDSQLWQAYKYT